MDGRQQKQIDFERGWQLKSLDEARLSNIKIQDGSRMVPVSSMLMKATLRAIDSYGRGVECWPSVSSLAKVANCNERSIRRAVKALQALSLLIVERKSRGGRNRVNHYRIVWTELAVVRPNESSIKRTLCPVDSSDQADIVTVSSGHCVRYQADTMSDEAYKETTIRNPHPLTPSRDHGEAEVDFSNFISKTEGSTMDAGRTLFATDAKDDTTRDGGTDAGTEATQRHPVDCPAPNQGDRKRKLGRRLMAAGMHSAKSIDVALADGATLDEIESVVDYWEANPGKWGVGALHVRILNAPVCVDPAQGWPTPNEDKPKCESTDRRLKQNPVLRWSGIRREIYHRGISEGVPLARVEAKCDEVLEEFLQQYPHEDRLRIHADITAAGV